MVDLLLYKNLYIKTIKENVESLKNATAALSVNKLDTNALEQAYRSSHMLNSKAALMSDNNISEIAKKIEDLLDQVKKGQNTITDEVILFLQQSAELISKYILNVQNSSSQNSSPQPQSAVSSENPKPLKTQTKVLVVEDDIFFQKFYTTKLSERNFNVAVAEDGEEGTKKIAEFKPDIILLDIIMPKKNGFELLESLGKNPSNPPIIVFSSLGQEQDIAKARSLGASDYVNKSFYDFDNLLLKIQALLKK